MGEIAVSSGGTLISHTPASCIDRKTSLSLCRDCTVLIPLHIVFVSCSLMEICIYYFRAIHSTPLPRRPYRQDICMPVSTVLEEFQECISSAPCSYATLLHRLTYGRRLHKRSRRHGLSECLNLLHCKQLFLAPTLSFRPSLSWVAVPPRRSTSRLHMIF